LAPDSKLPGGLLYSFPALYAREHPKQGHRPRLQPWPALRVIKIAL
jgi:hypothetical protein